MHSVRQRLGQLLVDGAIISSQQLQDILERQKVDGRRLGTLLVEAGWVNETQLTQILSRQLNAPWVSLYHIDFSRQLLNLIPRDISEHYCLVPIYVRLVRSQGNTLYVAMDDPTNEEALQACTTASGLPTRAMIAPPSDIRNAIRVYYGAGRSGLGPASSPLSTSTRSGLTFSATAPATPHEAPPGVSSPSPSAAFPEAASSVIPSPSPLSSQPSPPQPSSLLSSEAPPAATQSSLSVSPEAPDTTFAEIPSPPHKGPRMVTLTLLDGTTLTLPAKPVRPKPEHKQHPQPAARVQGLPQGQGAQDPDTQLTTRDLIAALQALSQGTDASEVLGPNPRWEAMFGALLSLLLQKHLIADWEFIEEFQRF